MLKCDPIPLVFYAVNTQSKYIYAHVDVFLNNVFIERVSVGNGYDTSIFYYSLSMKYMVLEAHIQYVLRFEAWGFNRGLGDKRQQHMTVSEFYGLISMSKVKIID